MVSNEQSGRTVSYRAALVYFFFFLYPQRARQTVSILFMQESVFRSSQTNAYDLCGSL